ncbi:MAG: hypothetical protein IJT90_03945 [Bacteroidaceae bacterium]|nr:hypothetical protein [Bacteroidaceae bacterium]
MTIKDVFEMRKQGRIEEAYNAARRIYSTNTDQYASSLMFWTAVDMLKFRVTEDRVEDAKLIYKALERLIGNVTD